MVRKCSSLARHFGDVLESGVTLTFDLLKIKGQNWKWNDYLLWYEDLQDCKLKDNKGIMGLCVCLWFQPRGDETGMKASLRTKQTFHTLHIRPKDSNMKVHTVKELLKEQKKRELDQYCILSLPLPWVLVLSVPVLLSVDWFCHFLRGKISQNPAGHQQWGVSWLALLFKHMSFHWMTQTNQSNLIGDFSCNIVLAVLVTS